MICRILILMILSCFLIVQDSFAADGMRRFVLAASKGVYGGCVVEYARVCFFDFQFGNAGLFEEFDQFLDFA